MPGAEAPGIETNAYTNVMAAWILARVPELLDLLPLRRREGLCRALRQRLRPRPAPGQAGSRDLPARRNGAGSGPEHCFVVEDAPAGVKAARAGGMTTLGVARLGDAALLQAAGADMVVTSLDEVDPGELAYERLCRRSR